MNQFNGSSNRTVIIVVGIVIPLSLISGTGLIIHLRRLLKSKSFKEKQAEKFGINTQGSKIYLPELEMTPIDSMF